MSCDYILDDTTQCPEESTHGVGGKNYCRPHALLIMVRTPARPLGSGEPPDDGRGGAEVPRGGATEPRGGATRPRGGVERPPRPCDQYGHYFMPDADRCFCGNTGIAAES